MKFLKLQFSNFGKSDYFLFHGNQIQFFSSNNDDVVLKQIQPESVIQKKKFNTRFLLGSPFVKTFVQETIQIRKKELLTANLHTLPFCAIQNKYRSVKSFQINANKSLTIHSHLTPEGVELISKYNIKKNWLPIISHLLPQVFKLTMHQDLVDYSKINMLFDSELLMIKFNPGFNVTYIPYLQCILADQKSKKYFLECFLSNQTTSSSGRNYNRCKTLDLCTNQKLNNKLFLKKLLSQRKLRRIKTVSLPFNLSIFRFRKFIDLRLLLTVSLIILFAWSYREYNLLNHLKTKKIELEKSTEILNSHLIQMTRFSRHEKQYFKLLALKNAISEVTIDPEKHLLKIDEFLPPSVWMLEYQASQQNTNVVFLDSGKSEVTSLLDLIDANIGKSSLVSNEKIELDNFSANHISVIIDKIKNESNNY